MRHRKTTLRLNKKPAHARMMQRNLVTSLLLYESIRTTKNRARVVQPIVDRLIATAKRKPPHVAIRAINAVVTDTNASRKIMEVFVERYAQRSSGMTRIVPVGARKGDGAQLVDLQLLDTDTAQKAPERETSPSSKKPAKKKSASPSA